MRLLLDTSTFLWFITGDVRLPDEVATSIRSPEHQVWLSVVSHWEVMVKHGLGRLPLPEEPARYLPKQRRRHGIDSLPLRERALAHLAKLPALHRDPFDRMLVCQAIQHDAVLVTSDALLHAYPAKTYWSS